MLMTVWSQGPSGLSHVSVWMAISSVENKSVLLCAGLAWPCWSVVCVFKLSHTAACLPVLERLLCDLWCLGTSRCCLPWWRQVSVHCRVCTWLPVVSLGSDSELSTSRCRDDGSVVVCFGAPLGVGERLPTPQVLRLRHRRPRVPRRKRDCTPALFLTWVRGTSATSLCTSVEEGLHLWPSSTHRRRVPRRERERPSPSHLRWLHRERRDRPSSPQCLRDWRLLGGADHSDYFPCWEDRRGCAPRPPDADANREHACPARGQHSGGGGKLIKRTVQRGSKSSRKRSIRWRRGRFTRHAEVGRGFTGAVHWQVRYVPVVLSSQVPTIQTVQKTVGVPQVQFLDQRPHRVPLVFCQGAEGTENRSSSAGAVHRQNYWRWCCWGRFQRSKSTQNRRSIDKVGCSSRDAKKVPTIQKVWRLSCFQVQLADKIADAPVVR